MPNVSLAIQRAAKKYGVSPEIYARLIQQESGGNNKARSPAGARGIAQFIPETAKEYGVNLNDNRITDDLEGGARYLADALKRTGGNYHQALSIYNSGRPEGYKSIPETANYVKSILGGSSPSKTSPAPKAQAAKSSPGDRRAAVLAYAQNPHAQGAVQSLAAGLVAARTPSSPTRTPSTSGSKLATFDGKRVASWMVPVLTYARKRGWNGTITSGYRNDKAQTAIYKSGVRPAAKPKALGGGGSKHSETGFLKGAVDVTDPQTLNKILRRKHSRLKAAGAKDPPHFSVPENGQY